MSKGLREALAVEYEAIYALGAAGSRLESNERDLVMRSDGKHRDRRDTAIEHLKKRDAKIPQPQPAYQLSVEVSDAESAKKLVSEVEKRTVQAWRAALGDADKADRAVIVDAYADAASVAASWRASVDESPSLEAFPGRPQ